MADPAWFFSTLAQSVAASIGFIIALVTGMYSDEARQFETAQYVMDRFVRACQVLFVVGVVIPMGFLVTLPRTPEWMVRPWLLLLAELGLLAMIAVYGWRLFDSFRNLSRATVPGDGDGVDVQQSRAKVERGGEVSEEEHEQ